MSLNFFNLSLTFCGSLYGCWSGGGGSYAGLYFWGDWPPIPGDPENASCKWPGREWGAAALLW